MDVEDVYSAAVVGLGELALSGCTTAFDHHYVVRMVMIRFSMYCGCSKLCWDTYFPY